MSVGVLAAGTPVGPAAPRADKKVAGAGEQPAGEFRNLVKGEDAAAAGSKARAEAGENQDGSPAKAEAGEGKNIWHRIGSILGAQVGNAGGKAEGEADGDATKDGVEEDGLGAQPDMAMIQHPAVAATGKAKAAGKQTGDVPAEAAKAARPNMGADGEAVAAAARTADAPAAARTVTPGANPGEAATTIGHKPDGQQQVAHQQPARQAMPDDAQGPSRSSTAEIVVPERRAGGDTDSRDDRGGQREGGNGERMASNANQAQNGNRLSGVTVVSQQTTPAMPVQPAAMSNTAAAFTSSVADGVLSAARAEAASQATFAPAAKAGPVTTLNIQLQPAELGMVTARLSGTEGQLSIEITVDNAEARHRLTSDSDAIVNALRGMGIEVDRFTIQQSQANAGNAQNGAARDNGFAQSGEGRGERQDQASRQGSERDDGTNRHNGQGGTRADRGSGGVYI